MILRYQVSAFLFKTTLFLVTMFVIQIEIVVMTFQKWGISNTIDRTEDNVTNKHNNFSSDTDEDKLTFENNVNPIKVD